MQAVLFFVPFCPLFEPRLPKTSRRFLCLTLLWLDCFVVIPYPPFLHTTVFLSFPPLSSHSVCFFHGFLLPILKPVSVILVCYSNFPSKVNYYMYTPSNPICSSPTFPVPPSFPSPILISIFFFHSLTAEIIVAGIFSFS